MKIYKNLFNKIISLANLFSAWDKFKHDKQQKRDVQKFSWQLEQNIFQLHHDLKYHMYKHQPYTSFYINDPKQRHIHKASVRDRVLHHAVFSILNPLFEETFISHSFSCRIDKGTHAGVDALESIMRAVSKNYTVPCFALKCDVQKFFASVDHYILINIISKRIKDDNVMWLLKIIIESFVSPLFSLFSSKGLPIGNLTSQLFANIYLNELDQFVKHQLGVKHYVRYTDDFVLVANNEAQAYSFINPISRFLEQKLALRLHPKKIIVRKIRQGVDFLGYVVLPHHRVLRSKTKTRMFRKLHQRINQYHNKIVGQQTIDQALQSYLGVLSHANTHELSLELKNRYWFWLSE
ncbi:MAG: reverse transcriptase/maturase family protein [Patescibacteria group bacterium]